jgi:hypothetical protein
VAALRARIVELGGDARRAADLSRGAGGLTDQRVLQDVGIYGTTTPSRTPHRPSGNRRVRFRW